MENIQHEKYGIKFKYPTSLIPSEGERTHPAGNSFEISFREGNDLALTVVIYLENPTGEIDKSLEYIKTSYSDAQKVIINNYPALRYFNNNNVIFFSGLKSYSFINDFLGVVEPLTAKNFELIVDSVILN